MNTFEIIESFNWLSPQFKLVDSGKNTIRIKGVALKGNVVSRNKRKYVDEELKKAARTWIGKPVTINHNKDRKVGNIVWMEYEDGALEYLADVNKQPYVGLLRDKSTDIRGVSIEADFLHNRCPRCGDKFYTEEDFAEHMWTKHFVKTDATKEPHGILGQALSLVLAPEEPGYPDSTVELAETVGKPGLQLLETVIKVKEEEENYMAKLNEKAVVTPEPRIPWNQKVKEQEPRTDAERAKSHFNISDEEWEKLSDEQKQEYIDKLPERGSAKEQEEPCPEGEHKNEEGECVPDEPVKEQEEPCPSGEHRDPETGECVPDKMEEQEELSDEQIKAKMLELQNQIDALSHKTYPTDTSPERKQAQVELDALYAKKRGLEDLLAQRVVIEQEEPCLEGEHRDAETGECVPDKVEEQEEHKCGEDEHWDEIQDKCVPNVAEQTVSTQECPVGFHRDAETGECVPDEAALPEPLPNVVVGEIKLQTPTLKPKLVETLTAKQLRLGEPFADYADFADCVSKNQDKDDPEAYCGTIKHQVEGETVKLPEGPMTELVKPIATLISKEQVQNERRNTLRREKALLAKANETVELYNGLPKLIMETLKPLQDNDALIVKRLNEVVGSLNKTGLALEKQIVRMVKSVNQSDKAIAKHVGTTVESLAKSDKQIADYTVKKVKLLETKLATHVKTHLADVKKLRETMPKPDLTWKQHIVTLNDEMQKISEEFKEAKGNYDKTMAKADSVHEENEKTLKTVTEELEKKNGEIAALKEEITHLKEASDKKLKETQSLGVRVDNLEEKRKGKFQGHNKTGEETPQEYAEDPLKKGD